MKKLILFIVFSLVTSVGYSQTIYYDITTPLKMWLLSNEAKAMSEIGCDDIVTSKSSMPFSIMPNINIEPKKSEEELWSIHRRIYLFIDEVQKIYDLAKLYGNGKFAIMIKKARPEIWGYSSLRFTCFSIPNYVCSETRKSFLDTLFNTLGINSKRDINLSERLKASIKRMKDEEFRLLKEYISTYKALYPSDKSVVVLEQFLNQGTQKPFATSLTDILKSSNNIYGEKNDSSNSDDPLSELETLSNSSSSSNTEEESKPVIQMEEPDPNEVNIYDIW